MSTLINREKLFRYFTQIFDTFKDGVCVTDCDGTILYLNNKYEQLANLKSSDMLGQSVEKIRGNGTVDFAVNPDVVKLKKPVTGIQSVCTGPNLFIDGYPIFDDQGEVTLVVAFIRDMKATQELKKRVNYQQKQLEAYQVQSADKTKYPQMFETDGLRKSYAKLSRVASTDAPVLLLGETGVGKGVFAKELHAQSARHKKHFIKADCSCIPENLMESEFFGYAPGAFSGASTKGKTGFFEKADSGTLFLDEIGELPLHQQAKLLGVLQDREIVRIGSTIPIKVDVRIITATNRDLEKEVEAGRFRSDLYYRLKVAEINIPPLRERCEDIPLLVDGFLTFYTHKYGRNMALSPEVKNALYLYSWPGNVREIENIIISLIVTCEKNMAELTDLPSRISSKHQENSSSLNLSAFSLADRSLSEIMGDLEKKVVMNVLNRSGSMSEAAKQLKVDRTTIFRKIKKFSQ